MIATRPLVFVDRLPPTLPARIRSFAGVVIIKDVPTSGRWSVLAPPPEGVRPCLICRSFPSGAGPRTSAMATAREAPKSMLVLLLLFIKDVLSAPALTQTRSPDPAARMLAPHVQRRTAASHPRHGAHGDADASYKVSRRLGLVAHPCIVAMPCLTIVIIASLWATECSVLRTKSNYNYNRGAQDVYIMAPVHGLP